MSSALAEEFNSMSTELSRRLDELSRERARLREAIRRIGHTFAPSLDPPALLELALKIPVDAVRASGGSLCLVSADDESPAETLREGSLSGLEHAVHAAERGAERRRVRRAAGDRRESWRSHWASRTARHNPLRSPAEASRSLKTIVRCCDRWVPRPRWRRRT
jgi:hypothetical protein